MTVDDLRREAADLLDTDFAMEVESAVPNIDGDLREIVLHYITGKRVRVAARSDFDGTARLVISEE